ncbi:Scr1 family TA system antitoxin-like transcriptional regulator [Actinoplanes sp. CA-051413]|uniref:Scr1 family TA system antitoxin-like transcriptional regulator n=1 Tax=Actinoplanes sp. CA-051413 TaxID=3239899 RepID=UPI003D977149
MTNDFVSDGWLTAEDGLARKLREAREAARLSGNELAAATGIQPARVSRLQSGKRVPTVEEIRAWAAATALSEAETNHLLGMLDEYHSQRIDYETRNKYGLTGAQLEYNKLFEDTKHFRTFATAQVPGYLQVADYARQILTEMQSLNKAPDDVERAVSVRLKRAEHLNNVNKKFEIILAESSLRILLCAPDVMRAQIGSLYTLIGRPNVRFGIIPQGVRLTTTPQNAFGVYDEDLVVVETFAVDEKYRGKVPEKYIQVMDLLWENAIEGDGARDILSDAMADLPRR